MYAYILTLLADHEAAQDVLQNTNLVLWKKAKEFDLDTSFGAWSSSVAYYEVLAYRKRLSQKRPLFSDEVLALVAATAAEETQQSSAKSVALHKCLQTLPKPQLELIRQRYDKEISITKLADSLQKSENALIQSLYRIRRRLAQCIKRRLTVQSGN